MEFSLDLLSQLSDLFGDSYYIFCSNVFSSNYDQFLNAFRKEYPKTKIAYSYKTNYIPYICSLVNRKGGYAEVVSEMEYDLATTIGVPLNKIIVNGPYKPHGMLRKCLLNGSIINLDSLYEIEAVQKISDEYPGLRFNVGLRCNFEIVPNFVSRFGFDIEGEDFKGAFLRISKIPNVHIAGLHCHFPNREIETFKTRLDKMLSLSFDLFKKPPQYIDIGGGFWGALDPELKQQFGVKKLPTFEDYAKVIAGNFKKFFSGYKNSEKPVLFIEPGTALVANTMYFVTKVIEIKKIRGKYISITAGSKLNLGGLSLKVNLPLTVVKGKNKNSGRKYKKMDICGYTCIESDILYKDYNGFLERGDFLVFSNVGSYSIVFKPPFILPNVPMIDLSDKGKMEVIKRQETLEDILSTYLLKEEENGN